jgi:aryl-alcohol dehydrogenase-like predicted oxidoreductase
MHISSNFSSLGLGTSHLGSLGSRISYKDASVLFAKALENNVTLVDTSDTYGSGDSERIIGKAIDGKRNEFFIMTKAGFPYMALPGFLSPMNQIGKKILQSTHSKKNYSKNYLISSLHRSLKRLNTDYVDAFVLHEPFADELLMYDDCWEALHLIKQSGMAKNVGISTNDLASYKLAKKHISLDIVQTSMPYNVNNIDTVFDCCKQQNIKVVANQVLRPNKILLENEKIRELLSTYFLKEKDFVSVLIAHGVYHKKADCVLIGTRNPNHLIQNAIGLKNLSHLNELFAEISKLTV